MACHLKGPMKNYFVGLLVFWKIKGNVLFSKVTPPLKMVLNSFSGVLGCCFPNFFSRNSST